MRHIVYQRTVRDGFPTSRALQIVIVGMSPTSLWRAVHSCRRCLLIPDGRTPTAYRGGHPADDYPRWLHTRAAILRAVREDGRA